MAVDKPVRAVREPTVRDFWPKHRRHALLTTLGVQLLIALVVGGALLVSGVSALDQTFIITMIAMIVASAILSIILMSIVLSPLHDLMIALTHTSGEPTDESMPNPNMRRYEQNGLRPVLTYIYESSASRSQQDSKEVGQEIPQQLDTALNQTNAGFAILDSSGNLVFANKKAPVVTDSSGQRRLELLFEKEHELAEWLENCRANAVHAEKIWRRVPNRTVGSEDRRIFDVTANYEKGSAAEVVLVMFDSSAKYQPEDEDLDFISFAAHELRGPITVIRGYLDVLIDELDSKLEPDQKQLMKRLVVSANRLSGYINNILNTSKYDRRHLKIHLAEESLTNIYDIIKDDMLLRAQSQNRLLTVNLPADLPLVAADRSSLSEVISNLIDNALKYSNEGGAVYVSARQKDDRFVEVSIQDNGIGMPANVLGNLFHKFYRSHRSRETVAGTGIGLYICKAIVESHGGTIGVTSTEGQGSTFSFTVPVYASVADKLLANNNSNTELIKNGEGWIRNHSMFKG